MEFRWNLAFNPLDWPLHVICWVYAGYTSSCLEEVLKFLLNLGYLTTPGSSGTQSSPSTERQGSLLAETCPGILTRGMLLKMGKPRQVFLGHQGPDPLHPWSSHATLPW